MATVFLIIGGVGLAVLAASLLFGEIADAGPFESDGPFSVGALAAFAGAFGFGGAIAAAVLPDLGSTTLLIAVLCGIAAAFPAAWLTIRLTRAVMNMRTDATLTRQDLLGTRGVVVTPVPANGYGEVRLAVAGQQIKFNARADLPIPAGASVFVVATPTETSVVVEATDPILPGV